MTRPPRALLLALALGALGGCKPGAGRDPHRLTVFAAASLTDAFAELARDFEAANAGHQVSLIFAGSQVLRLQLEQGAPADVFASANRRHIDALARAGLVRERQLLARNELVVIVPRDNPSAIASLADLPRARRLVLGTPSVPIGIYTRQLLRRARPRFGSAFEASVLAHAVSEENNVRLLRAKVELGEADAAIVYRTDAATCPGVRVVPIPGALNVRADYLIGLVARSARPELARRWIRHVRSAAGRRTLAAHGFVTAR